MKCLPLPSAVGFSFARQQGVILSCPVLSLGGKNACLQTASSRLTSGRTIRVQETVLLLAKQSEARFFFHHAVHAIEEAICTYPWQGCVKAAQETDTRAVFPLTYIHQRELLLSPLPSLSSSLFVSLCVSVSGWSVTPTGSCLFFQPGYRYFSDCFRSTKKKKLCFFAAVQRARRMTMTLPSSGAAPAGWPWRRRPLLSAQR